MLERAFSLEGKASRMGFIVPVSSISTDRYESLQRLLSTQLLYYSSFDDRPSRLFEGLEHIRLTIHLLGSPQARIVSYSTRYNKWNSEERGALFQLLTYAAAKPALVTGTMPKLCHRIEESIIEKLRSDKRQLSHFYSKNGNHRIYYSRKVGYFLQVLDFVPEVLDGSGKIRPPSEFKELAFDDQIHARAALACLNANLFYWVITVFSDCRHVNKREIDSLPVDLRRLTQGKLGRCLERLSLDLMRELDENSECRSMQFSHDNLTVQCIMPKLSKPTVDEIDRALAKHYGFTDEELDFIINYDIKYRMGGADGGEEE